MAVKPKCKYCNEQIEPKDKYVLIEKTKNDKAKRTNLHKDCLKEYEDLMKFKENELYWFDQVYETLMEFLGYSSEQKLPKGLVTRIQDLRNGTVMKRGVGRVVQNKEGYKYEIILDTMLASADSIRWSMSNKGFEKESQKISYLMAIIESNINDSYVRYEARERSKNNAVTNDIIEEEKRMLQERELEEENIQIKPVIKPKPKSKNTGISRFLDDDDL